jgi:hypothetical protein
VSGWGCRYLVFVLPGVCCLHAGIVSTTASIRPDNSLIADIQVTASGSPVRVSAGYHAAGVDPLVSAFATFSAAGRATVTIGRLRANTTYQYTATAVDAAGVSAGSATGSFTTGGLPAALSMSTFALQGRMTAPLIILPLLVVLPGQAPGGAGSFRGFVALDLHSSDAPQIVWYYNNAPSTASGYLQTDPVGAITRQPNGNFLFADAGSGPPPLAADAFLREIAVDGSLLAESHPDCSVTPPAGSAGTPGWIWGQGNDVAELLPRGAGGFEGAILHTGKVVKDPFFDLGLARSGARLQLGATIRRWNPLTGVDEVVWDPFRFLDPWTDRTNAATSDPAANSNSQIPMPCSGSTLNVEDWMHANSLQVAPTGELLMSIRHLDTVIAIRPDFAGIAWRIGGPGSDFTFPNPGDRFYHQHFVRMLDSGNLLLIDNGNGRPAAEGGQYTRALELALDWHAMTATKVWEYRHPVIAADGRTVYKYADKVGSAQRLANGNTLVLFGSDVNPSTLIVNDPQTFTLVEAGATRDGQALATLDIRIPGNVPIYRALPLDMLFGEVPAIAERPTGGFYRRRQ